jgi:hypothetical protein
LEWRERGGFVSYFLARAGKGRVEDSGPGETVGSFGSAGWRISGDAGLDGALDGGVGLFRIAWVVAPLRWAWIGLIHRLHRFPRILKGPLRA